MKLYLARHGRTNYNDLDLCNADPAVDVHLTPTGVEQVKALADTLKQVRFDHLFVSELKRTQQTAEIVNTFHHLTPEIDARLNDIRTGFESKPFAEYRAALVAASDKWTARFNDGESIEDMKDRVASFLQDLRVKDYRTVLVVTSEWIVYAAVAIIRQLSNEEAWNLNTMQGTYIVLDI